MFIFDICFAVFLVVSCSCCMNVGLFKNILGQDAIDGNEKVMAMMWELILLKPVLMLLGYFGLMILFSWLCVNVWHMPITGIVGAAINVAYLYYLRTNHESYKRKQAANAAC